MNDNEFFQKLFSHLSEDNAEEIWLKTIKEYIIRGGKVGITNSLNGWSLLHYASENLFCDVASFLLENGIDVDSKAKNGSTPYLVALDASIDAAIQEESSKIDFSIVKLLLKRGANVDIRTSDGLSLKSILEVYGSKATEEYYREVGDNS